MKTIAGFLMLPALCIGISNGVREIKNAIDREYNCIGLLGRDATHTTMLRESCRNLMKTNLFQISKHILDRTPENNILEATGERLPRKKRLVIVEEMIRPTATCPTIGRTNRVLPLNERSLSPYKPIITYDRDRFPQYLVQQQCLCNGCINSKTGKEDLRVKSMGVTYKSIAFRNDSGAYEKTDIDIVAGCTCVFLKLDVN